MNKPNSLQVRSDAQLESAAKLLFRREIVGLLFFAIIYGIAIQLGLLFVENVEGIASIWPASGVTLAALLLTPKLYWKKILAVIFFINAAENLWTGGNPLFVSLGFALANTVEPLLGAWILTSLAKSKITFERAIEVFALLCAAVVSAGVAGALGASVSTLAFDAPFTNVFALWWVADGLGMLLVAPLIVLWTISKNVFKFTSLRKNIEVILLIFALIQFAWLLFGPFTNPEKPILRTYMLFPLLMWMAFKFTPRGMAGSLAALSLIAFWGSMHRYGMFEIAEQSHSEHLISLQLFLSTAVFSGLLLSAVATERRQAEQMLRESESNFHSVITESADGIVLSDETGRIVEFNHALEEITGYSRATNAGKFIWDFTFQVISASLKTNERYFQTKKEIQKALETGRASFLYKTLEAPYKHADGSTRFIQQRVFSIRTNKGWRLGGVFRDVTERIKAEETLRESEEKYRTVADFTYDWEAWHAPYGVYLYVSPSCKRITGYAAEEFMNDPNLVVKITHPDDQDMITQHFHWTTNGEKAKDAQFDFRIITADGKTRWINHSCTAVFSEDGRWLGRRESNRDVTVRKRDEAALRSRLWLSKFSDAHTVDELLQNTLNEAEALTDSQIGFFHFLEADQKTLKLQTWSTNTLLNMCTAEGKGQHYSLEKAGVWVDCVAARAPVIHNDYASLPHRKGLPEGHAPVIRELVVPIMRDDLIVAIFGVGNKPNDYDELDVKTVTQLGDMVWEVVQRKRSEEEVLITKNALEIANKELQIALARETQLAHTDALTGINNRRHLFELAEREFDVAARYKQPFSVLMFDLDHFKRVNDKFGHQVGDLMLQRVTQVACAELRSADIIGRYGGEEFVIILPMTNTHQAYALAERIRSRVAEIREPTSKGNVVVTLSVGVAEIIRAMQTKHFDGGDKSVERIIHRADEAMYAAKEAGRNRTVIYNQK